MSGDSWQPIDTVPKDGSRVLIWVPASPRHPGYPARYFDTFWYGVGWANAFGNGILVYASNEPEVDLPQWFAHKTYPVEPTHWMPAPIPPVAA